MINTDPMLGPLAFNGGPTQTFALLAGSPAINTGQTGAPGDQRGYPRIGMTDIGAFEFGSFGLSITSIQRLSDGSVQLEGRGVVNANFSILSSPDLTAGTFGMIGLTTSDPFGNWQFIDTGAVGPTKLFYKATYP